ncbi:hypothetical protein EDB85DRAFT_2024430 [Lactarius pseudohatsudake]|nr:hypothetical protein EDB85DRAFT_2024430 [Lactarius pseudohatsudake]
MGRPPHQCTQKGFETMALRRTRRASGSRRARHGPALSHRLPPAHLQQLKPTSYDWHLIWHRCVRRLAAVECAGDGQLPGHRKGDNGGDTFARGTPPCGLRATCDLMTAISDAHQEALRRRKLQAACNPNDDVAVKQLHWIPDNLTPTWRRRGETCSTNASCHPDATDCLTTMRIIHQRATDTVHNFRTLPTKKMAWRRAGVINRHAPMTTTMRRWQGGPPPMRDTIPVLHDCSTRPTRSWQGSREPYMFHYFCSCYSAATR